MQGRRPEVLAFLKTRRIKTEFEAQVLPLADRLFGFAYYLSGNRDDAQDLVQETLIKAFRSFSRFTPGTNLKAWLYTILANTHKNNQRRRGGWLELDEAIQHEDETPGLHSTTDSPEVVAIRAGTREKVRRAMDRLPPEFRAVVLLADLEEYSYREIADILECPMGTVMSRLHRGRQAIKRQLEGERTGQGKHEIEAPHGM